LALLITGCYAMISPAGPARFRLHMPEVALELKRVWHPWHKGFKVSWTFCCSTLKIIKKQ